MPQRPRQEIEAARTLGIPVTVHACGPVSSAGQIAALAQDRLLGPDLQVVHANCATPAEIAQLAEAGATVSVSPFSEILIGYGLPRTTDFLAAGIPTGLSVDTTSLGMAGEIGSLTPGKRADLILVETGSPNLGVFTDPAHMLVTAAQPANVDTVIVDGQILKRGGVLTMLDPAQVSTEARAALAGVRARAASVTR